MRRIAMGAAIASLRVQQLGGPQAGKSVKLVELRSGRGADDPFDEQARRVVVVCAEEATLGASLAEARRFSGALCDADLLVVPLVTADATGAVATPSPALIRGEDDAPAVAHVALPQDLATWQTVLADERATAASQDANIAQRGFTLILKKNGRVGTRRLGLPDWQSLAGDVASRAAAGLDVKNI